MSTGVTIESLNAGEAGEAVAALASVLKDCVEGGASVSFMAPLPVERATAFWRDVAVGVAAGDRILLVARSVPDRKILGTVQVVSAQPENQPHRADIAKMLVSPSARRRGIGAMLMREAERAAWQAGKTVLVLDTVTGGDAERLYERLGWARSGIIPKYALWPHGGYCDTTVFFKERPESPAPVR
ncbi:MAG: GNAT family N-acetyltransferase [Microvirga sp.]